MTTTAAPAHDAPRSALIDGCGRRIDHLRLSITAACDLACRYCRPNPAQIRAPGALTFEQRVAFVRLLHERYGLSQVRITGGEPLLHPQVTDLIRALRQTAPRLALAMTTNGRRLAALAHKLRAAGLDRLNVSLDSLEPSVYAEITGGRLTEVLDGLDAAAAAGFTRVKINTVVLRGLNDSELPSLVRWAARWRCEIRFLEAMPIGPAADFNRRHFVPAAEMRECLRPHYCMTPLDHAPGETARRYRAETIPNGAASAEPAAAGVIGFIAPVTEPFCGQCRRIRVTADGRLYPCLLDSHCVDIRPAWSRGTLDETAMNEILHAAVAGKQPQGPRQQATQMVQLGG